MDSLPHFSDHEPSDPLVVKVAHGFDEMAMVIAVRGAVVLGEINGTYSREFDGNDLAATHVIALQNGEPIGTLRIRYFADFAKLERLSIREPYRKLRTVNTILRFALRLCRRKGYKKVYGLALLKVVPLWRRFGAYTCGQDSDTPRGILRPLVCPIPEEPDAPEPISESMLGTKELDMMIRHPEGQWPAIPVPVRQEKVAVRAAAEPELEPA